MENIEKIKSYFHSFTKGDIEHLIECYHSQIRLKDPIFGSLTGKDVSDMLRMIIDVSQGNYKISFSNIYVDKVYGAASWRAEYIYAPTGRKIVTDVTSEFQFQNGKIFRQTNKFDLWLWFKMAYGLKGYLIGWASFIRTNLHKRAYNSIRNHILHLHEIPEYLIPDLHAKY